MTNRSKRHPGISTAARAAAPPATRTSKSRTKSIDGGARRVDAILRDPAAIAALERLEIEHGSATAAITAALIRCPTTTTRIEK